MSVKPVPEGYATVTPYLTVSDANGLLDFIIRAFAAREQHVMRGADGSVRHADLMIGDLTSCWGRPTSSGRPCRRSSTSTCRIATPCIARR